MIVRVVVVVFIVASAARDEGGGVEMEVVGPTEKEVKVERGAPFPLSSWPAHSLAVSQYNRRASRAEGENATGACVSSGERMGVPRFARSLICFSADSYLRPPSRFNVVVFVSGGLNLPGLPACLPSTSATGKEGLSPLAC